MYRNSSRRSSRTDEADVYWRRRFFTLAAGLGVITLLAWAFSGLSSGGSRQPGDSRAGNRPAPAAYGSSAASTLRIGSASPSTSRSGSVASSPSPARISASAQRLRSRKRAATAPPSVGGSAAASATGAAGGAALAGPHSTCPATDVVLSLFVGKTSYTPHQTPRFQIDVVSTDTAPCTFDLGPAALRLTIKSRTGVVWMSAACLDEPATRVEELRRGVPSVVSVTWNRRLSADGCGTGQPAARPGSYQAVASSGPVTSQPVSFDLR